ncbi:MAG: hypothetical protein D6725_10045 [Planctomycetota bacterium]|nr:MAG: hypothetical protein D6725_10045 [Planctomycetota bacterium]
MTFKRNPVGIVPRPSGRARNTALAVAVCLVMCVGAPVEAGVIPWLYNAIFGPVYYPPPAYYAGYGYAPVYYPASCPKRIARQMSGCMVAPPCAAPRYGLPPACSTGATNGGARFCPSQTVTYAPPVCPSPVLTCPPPTLSSAGPVCTIETNPPAVGSSAAVNQGGTAPAAKAADSSRPPSTFQQSPQLPDDGFQPREAVPPANRLETPPRPSSDAPATDTIETTIRQRKPAPAQPPTTAPPAKPPAESEFLPPAASPRPPADGTPEDRTAVPSPPESTKPTPASAVPAPTPAATPPAVPPEKPAAPAASSSPDPFLDPEASDAASGVSPDSAQRLTQRPTVVYVPLLRRRAGLSRAALSHAVTIARRAP